MLYKVWDMSAGFPVETPPESLHDVRGNLWKEGAEPEPVQGVVGDLIASYISLMWVMAYWTVIRCPSGLFKSLSSFYFLNFTLMWCIYYWEADVGYKPFKSNLQSALNKLIQSPAEEIVCGALSREAWSSVWSLLLTKEGKAYKRRWGNEIIWSDAHWSDADGSSTNSHFVLCPLSLCEWKWSYFMILSFLPFFLGTLMH